MSVEFKNTILIFSDGACSGNPGPGGYGSIIVFPEGQVQELGEKRTETTNNRMEILGVLKALQHVVDRGEDLWILTDSTYVIRGITQWIWGWKKNGWKTAEGSEVSNRDLWEALDKEVARRKKAKISVDWKYVRGHSGFPGNERCDEIATGFTQGKRITLFSGSLLKYPVAVHDLPEDMSLPPMKDKPEKVEAYSYLSYVNGELKRHLTWKDCEVAVKGRSGAKFKKATSEESEKQILKEWGFSPNKLPKKS